MNIIKTPIEGLFVIEPRVFKDERGYFMETFRETVFKEQGVSEPFVQDNESKSSKGVVRGLHYQLAPYSQAKLVRVTEGVVLDVALDLRRNSPTFGKWYSVELSAENKKQFYVPRGFAHGFSVLSETAIFSYKCDGYYQQSAERGILYNDPFLDIDWKLNEVEMIVSDKDLSSPHFNDAEFNFE